MACAGATFSAAATNSQLLRLFSVSGMQSAIMSLQGAVVALAAQVGYVHGGKREVLIFSVSGMQSTMVNLQDTVVATRVSHKQVVSSGGESCAG
eukprot:1141017-Pelagomonas_calceolata.AAC.5